MPSDKPRIATYTTKENIHKFKVLAALHNMSMSEYLNYLVEKNIDQYEAEHGPIDINHQC